MKHMNDAMSLCSIPQLSQFMYPALSTRSLNVEHSNQNFLVTEKQTRQFKPIDLIKQFRNSDNKLGFQSLTCLENSENCIHRIYQL